MRRSKFMAINHWANDKAYALLGPKNDAYGGEDEALLNFMFSQSLGIAMEDSVLSKMGDKMMRVSNLIHKGKAVVYEETVLDSLLDIKNYCGILICVLVEHGILSDPFPDEDSMATTKDQLVGDEYHRPIETYKDFKLRYHPEVVRGTEVNGSITDTLRQKREDFMRANEELKKILDDDDDEIIVEAEDEEVFDLDKLDALIEAGTLGDSPISKVQVGRQHPLIAAYDAMVEKISSVFEKIKDFFCAPFYI